MEGTGFQPTIDALFGERGFFPDAISSVMYKAQDNAQMLKDILDRITPDRDRRKRQVKAFLDTSYILCLEIMFYSLGKLLPLFMNEMYVQYFGTIVH